MKRLIVLLSLCHATAGVAAEPGYKCDPASGCREESGPSLDIGRGAMLSLPFGWRVYSYPTAPMAEMAGLREFRAFKNGMVVAISPFPNIDHRVVKEDMLCGIVSKASANYVRQSKEQRITAVPETRGDLVECHVAFTAANDGEKPFAVLANRHHASVTTYSISYKYIIFSISAVSEQMPDDEYRAVIKNIQEIH